VSEPREAEIGIRGATIQSAAATVLGHRDIHAHNSFAQKDAVHPEAKQLSLEGRNPTYTFAPASVTKLALRLA
jgi:alpha-L-arabinofuranosidase